MKAFIKFIIFISSICALTESGDGDNYFLIISCVLMIIWSISSLFMSAIDYLSTEDVHNYSPYNNNSSNNKYVNTYRQYTTTTSKETIKKITKNLKTNTNTKIVKNESDITNNNNDMITSSDNHPTRTLSLLPIRDILKNDYERKYPLTEETFVSDSAIIPIVGEKERPVANAIIPTIVEEVKVVEVETKQRKEVAIILIQNEDKLSVNRIAVYKAIIDAYKSKNISQSMIYTILQSITAIDVFSDEITIYASKLPLYSSKTITEEELITLIKKNLRDYKIEITIVERKDITIADYYITNTYF